MDVDDDELLEEKSSRLKTPDWLADRAEKKLASNFEVSFEMLSCTDSMLQRRSIGNDEEVNSNGYEDIKATGKALERMKANFR